jgi:hypothetical protein
MGSPYFGSGAGRGGHRAPGTCGGRVRLPGLSGTLGGSARRCWAAGVSVELGRAQVEGGLGAQGRVS